MCKGWSHDFNHCVPVKSALILFLIKNSIKVKYLTMFSLIMVITSMTWGLTHSQDLFYFSKQPEDVFVKSGSFVKLECLVSHQENIIYYWNMNDTRLANSSRKRQIGSDLHITRADRVLDYGVYSCIAENITSGYSITSRPAKLDVLWIGPNATVQLQTPATENEIDKGQEIILRCLVDGNGEVKYDWFRNDEQLVKFKGKRIHIKDVSPSNNGIYRCRAHNEAGTTESQVNFPVKVPGISYPRVKIIPGDVVAKKGSTIRMDCSFENSDELRWIFKNEPLKTDRKREILTNGSMLLKDVGSSDEGFYTCQGVKKIDQTNEKVQSFSAKLKMSFMEDLTMNSLEPTTTEPELFITREMRPFEITCFPPKAFPPAKVWWENQNGKIMSSVDAERSSLIFENPRGSSDIKNYSCVTENLSGKKNITIGLMISVQPVVTSDMELITVDEGETFSIPCLYKGSPPPATSFRWKKDRKYINQGRMMVNKSNGTLTIRQVQSSDRGYYTCEVNTTGFKAVESRPCKLNVNEKLKFTPRPVSKKLELGAAAKIPCKAQGSPTPVVRWLKERIPSQPLPSHVHDINGTLHFDIVYATDKGKYICIATSMQGTINATVDIDVIVAPRFTIKPQNPTEAYQGFSAMLHCMASGDPTPTIKWDKNGEINSLDSKRFFVFENGSLLLREVSEMDRGIYGCTAGNSGGLKREEALLIVKGVDKQLNDGSDSDGSMMTKTVTITLSAAAAYMILVIGLMVWCRYRRKKKKEAYLNASPENILLAKTENGDAPIINGEKLENNEIRKENGRKSDGTETTLSQSSGLSKRSSKSNQYEKLAFSRQNLNDLRLIGHGIFGQIFIAKTDLSNSPVLVKSLQSVRSENALIEFKRETDMFHRLSHDNIVKLLGLCRDGEPHYMILEYTDWGELKHFLQTTKKERNKLSISQILDIAKQISLGMEHLSNARFIHKDLAARNCIVGSDFKIKVSLIGFSKDVYSNDYMHYCNQLIPLRWLPYEAVFDDDYSTKSDVYSFAALCYELFHQGDQPFYSLPDSAVIEKLQHQELVLKPSKNAPLKMSNLLLNCASHNPRDRPTFSMIAITLGECLKDV